jgi:phosphoenolpyruvate carboxylase
VKLPRAISTALYSIGIPPELIGTGRGIKWLKKQNKLDLLESHYKNIRTDLLNSLQYLNRDLLKQLSKSNSAIAEISEDVKEIDAYLNHEEKAQPEHHKISMNIYNSLDGKKDITELIVSGGKIRKSLG